jgi:GDP-L-fucose synthase
MKNKKIIIFGGFGFVGSHLYDCLKLNNKVIRASRRNGYDLNNKKKIKKLFDNFKPDIAINCAVAHGGLSYINRKPAYIFHENSILYFNFYKIISSIKLKNNFYVINLISNCAYSGNLKIQKEKDWLDHEPHDSVLPFAIPKRIAFYLSKFYFKEFNIKTKNLLIPNAYGPGDYKDPRRTHALNGIIIRFLNATKKKDVSLQIWGTGRPRREWIYVGDIAKFIKLEIKNNTLKDYIPINLAQNKSYSILKISKIVKRILKSDILLKTDPTQMDGALVKQLSNIKFKKFFKKFKFEKIESGILKTINYYKNSL